MNTRELCVSGWYFAMRASSFTEFMSEWPLPVTIMCLPANGSGWAKSGTRQEIRPEIARSPAPESPRHPAELGCD